VREHQNKHIVEEEGRGGGGGQNDGDYDCGLCVRGGTKRFSGSTKQ
jgi:hypothetical protein